MRILIVILLFISSALDLSSQNFKGIKVNNHIFEAEPVLDINGCIKWHVDFRELKKTVLYKNNFLSVGLYGGIMAVDTSFSKINKEISKKLNTDLITNLAVRHDTLFAEKFNGIYYLNDNDSSLIKYKLKEPIKLFDILFEDDKYVFFPLSRGEFGSILFIYDKIEKVLRAISMGDEAKCIYFKDNKYFINASLRHGHGGSTYLSLKNVNSVNVVSKNYNLLLQHFSILPVTRYPIFEKNPTKESKVLSSVAFIDYAIMVNSTFLINKDYYHFTDFGYQDHELNGKILPKNKTFITKFINSKIEIIDTINEFFGNRTRSYDDITIIGSYFLNNGYYVVHNDQLNYINFIGTPDYEFSYTNDSVLIDDKRLKLDITKESYSYEPKFIRNIIFDMSPNVTIRSFGDNNEFDLTINEVPLRLNNRWNVLNKAFHYNDNIFLYFFNLGNEDHKYGLVEIYNLEKFIDIYCYKEINNATQHKNKTH